MPDRSATAGLRSDAVRNRGLILAAAHAVFLELGVDAPLDRIAARAGVGNATLYRHFPTRTELIKHVGIDSLERIQRQARQALAEQADPWAALVQLCRTVVEQHLIAMFPIVGPHVEPDAEFDATRDGLVTALQAVLTAAQEAGDLRRDIAAGDILIVLATITRPLPGLSAELAATAQARHLGVVLAGLRQGNTSDLPGAPITAPDITTSLTASRRRS